MKIHEVKFRNLSDNYSILIGNSILGVIEKKVRLLCPKTKKIALIIDKKVPKKNLIKLKKKLKSYQLISLYFTSSEKLKSLKTVNKYLSKLLSNNLNKSDLIISIGGGITGDVAGFVASIFKRGINFINIPTTLLAMVDSAIGGKTGVNSSHGKNLIGSFYQPKLVISDTSFLESLPKKEMICGYAEVLKHAIIKDKKFFEWLKINSRFILSKKSNALIPAIKKSCQIKMFFVNQDVHEKNLRMKLNFGHTFAHAIEVKNNYSKKITHGEAVLSGMILATRLSVIKNTCSKTTLAKIEDIYRKNNLSYTFKRFSKKNLVNSLIPYLKSDKKNNDEKINFILLKNIGMTTNPNKYKISSEELKKYSKIIAQY